MLEKTERAQRTSIQLNWTDMAKAELYSAEYIGSGTFIISKPGRKKKKLRQSRVKSPQRGARK